MLRRTASHKEHRKEVMMAIAKNSSKSEIIDIPIHAREKYVIANPPLTSTKHGRYKSWREKQAQDQYYRGEVKRVMRKAREAAILIRYAGR